MSKIRSPTIMKKSPQSNPTYMRWISGGFFVEKHLTQGAFSCYIPPPLGEILNFAPPILQSPWLARGPTPGASR